MNSTQTKCDIGLIGLAVMGENLVLNMASHGFTVAVYNRTTSRVDEFVNGYSLLANLPFVVRADSPGQASLRVEAQQVASELSPSRK